MSWCKIKFLSESNIVDRAFALAFLAQQRDVAINSPKGFAIFSGWEFSDDDPQVSYYTLYFSPVAASSCSDLLASFSPIPCDKPDRTKQRFGLVYGDLEGSNSWDLLK